MKTIIATTDYSRAAQNAVLFAAALASEVKATLLLFNATHLPIPTVPAPIAQTALQEALAENEARLQAMGERISHQLDVEVESYSTKGIFKEELDRLVQERKADLVVMGMRGSSVSRNLFGSLTTAVLYHARYPVLVVPEEASYRGLCRMIFAYNEADLTETDSLHLLQELAKAYDAHIQVLHVENLEKKREREKEVGKEKGINMEQLLRGIRHTYKFIRDEHVVHGIERGLAESRADLLVMVPHKASFWDTLLYRSNTRTLALHTHIPLLALPNSEQSVDKRSLQAKRHVL